ncbi:gliding motility-associated protein GldE [Portibacter marinus]|uniref:gliding motility-associated protein GldE n=1 Tax=Portibacter marinus TaxID=2898660 RepID=UPI001F45D6D5|nr:gliding motility-associated protein GldE [Portibacter marinus]
MDAEPPPEQGLFFLNIIFLLAINWGLIGLFATLLLLLISSALISGSEVAFFSLNNNDVEGLKKEDGNDRLIKLRDKPRSLLATILISNNFINIAIIIISDLILSALLPDGYFDAWSEWLRQHVFFLNGVSIPAISNAIIFTITVIGVTFLLVLFGEVLPKIYANINKIVFAKFMAVPLWVLMFVLGGFSKILVSWSNKIESRVDKHRGSAKSWLKDDIDKAIDLTVSKEENAEEEADILKGILKFSDVLVKQVMTSRMDFVSIDYQTNFRDMLKVVKETGFSRIPVYKDDLDNIEGILYVKDLLGHTDEAEDFTWQKFIRKEMHYIPESKKINELLKEFQSKRLHMAIVVDEYGGTSGIVTLEDIMEEIIGDIRDEFDEERDIEYLKIDKNNYIFEGKTLLNDVCRVIGEDLNVFDEIKGESDSLAGLYLEVTGKFPKVDGELDLDPYKLKIVSMTNKRIEKINLMIKR